MKNIRQTSKEFDSVLTENGFKFHWKKHSVWFYTLGSSKEIIEAKIVEFRGESTVNLVSSDKMGTFLEPGRLGKVLKEMMMKRIMTS